MTIYSISFSKRQDGFRFAFQIDLLCENRKSMTYKNCQKIAYRLMKAGGTCKMYTDKHGTIYKDYYFKKGIEWEV